ncbi:MAG: hypothetical protein ACOYIF_00670 [Acetivibrionales bacterium]|jgi:hypothetical protein
MPFFSIINALLILMAAAVVWHIFFGGGTAKKNEVKRTIDITNKIESIGGKLINIETSKKSECPFNNEIDYEDGSVYVFYKIHYVLDDENKEGWAILILRPSFITMNSAGAHDTEWIWRL